MIKKLLLSSLFFCSFTMYGQTYIMSNTPITTCGGTHLDPGGTGNYADNCNFVQTICSGTSNCVSLTFSSFGIESGYDFLAIHDGPSTSSPQVTGSPFTGSINPGTVTCSSGCLTLSFTSDFSIGDVGWSGTISCVACPPPPPPPNLFYGWTQRASVPAIGRHRGVAISIGNRGYAGLGHINAITDILYNDWWEYDPGTNSWTQKANFLPGPRMHPCGFSIGNYGYVGTGRDNAYVEQNDLYRYSPATNTWTAMAPMPSSGRRGAVAFAVSGKGYIGTGSYTNDFWQYNPATNSWLSVAPLPAAPKISSVAITIGTKGYVGTGDNGGPTGDFYEYDPVTNIWTAKASMPGLPRMEAAGFSINGKGYIGTGCDYQSGTNYQDFWEYDPATNYWNQITDFSGSARRYMSCFAIGTRGYGVFGTSGTNYNDLWEYGNYIGPAGVNELNANSIIKTYPNPFIEEVTFSISQEVVFGSNATLRIMDITGKTVKLIKNIEQHEVKIEREGMKKGMYFFEFENNTERTSGKFIAL
ncbi:MAG TPA: kelch repeat-containing protein [Bacteroidia bacterium]|jgi:N-acetylneuraminic acid mutarotase